MDTAITTLGQAGILGAALVLLGFAYWQLHNRLHAVQEARVVDAQRVATSALEREGRWLTTISELTEAINKHIERN